MEYTNLFTCIYARRSNDDAKDGESIENQVSLLKQYCANSGYMNIQVFTDDGYTGTNFDRPGFQKMYALIKHRRVKRVIVKDLSRFGRNSSEVGRYLGIEFPRYDVELISISDGPESSDPDSIVTQFKNMMNEFYSKDISDKQKLSIRARSNNGLHISSTPAFGYKLDPENRRQWIIDEPAASTVRYIFQLYNSGLSVSEIARILEKNKHLSPSAYNGYRIKETKAETNPYYWCSSSICSILKRQEYCGDTVNFKTYHKSFKDKQMCYRKEDEYVIIQDTQEAIISREEFEMARARRMANKRVRTDRTEHILDSVLYCGNCNARMYKNKNKNKKKNDIYFYICNKYRKSKSCTSHYIQEISLRKKVIKELLFLFCEYHIDKKRLKKMLSESINKTSAYEMKMCKERIEEVRKRISDISNKESRLYDDLCRGIISGDTFNSITDECNREIERLRTEQGEVFVKLDGINDRKNGINAFLQKLAVYETFTEDMIDKYVIEQLIERIEVAEKKDTSDDRKTSALEIRIYYAHIGYINIDMQE